MSPTPIAGTTALVTGASRGFGRGIAAALSQAGARVIGVARDPEPLRQLRAELGDSFILVTADAVAPATAGQLVNAYQPAILVLNAGATPLPRPLYVRGYRDTAPYSATGLPRAVQAGASQSCPLAP